MKGIIYIFISLFCLQNIQSQSFLFEEDTVSAAWVASHGSLSLSTEHYKQGGQSLCWETAGTSVVDISFTAFTAGTGNSAFLQIYSPEITNDTLRVEFLYYATVKRTAVFLCNYKGWHEFNRAYTEYVSKTSTTITSVRFTLMPTSAGARILYFDNVNFNRTTEANRIAGSHWLLDKSYLSSDTDFLTYFSHPVDIPVETPTMPELASLTSLRNTLKRNPTAGTSTALDAAKAYVNSLNIVRNADGSVRGNVINTSATALTDAFMTDLVAKLEVLAAEALKNEATKTLFHNFVDHLLDQGISEGLNYRVFSNSYNPARDIPAGFIDILPACTENQKVEMLKLVKWLSFYGTMYYPQETYLANLVSDVIYLCLPHMMAVAINQPDNAVAVRELKAFKRYLDRNTEYVPGGEDIFKPDGTGFHHGTQYNNYMYAYKTWVQYIYYLRGTPFRISADAYQRFKKAIISVYTMGTLDTGDSRYFANSLSGRKPFDTVVQFSKTYFDYLVSIGMDVLGSMDNEVASAYNYFFKTTKYNVPAQAYEGFYQFNYSPLGIYRKANWVASMRSPTTKFFGAEIYDDQNRFGRYQANGSLEILYSGSLTSNGYPSSSNGSGGWDWNVVPGATTVHYTSWQEMMPYKSPNGRFDQKTKTKNFAGALSFGDCGLFAADFDQLDTWSSSAYTATNLVYKKSMFAIDNMIFSLGSSIGSSGTYSTSMITATNLFQSINPSALSSTVVNGSTVTIPYNATLSTTSDNWIITPQGTGYFVPQGNDALVFKFDNQSTPNYTGADYAAPTTTVPAVKAYLNHGVKPSGKSYSFVAVPATNSASMQELASQMANGGGSIYQIQAQSNSIHALTYKPLNITAYSFFGAASNLSFGIVKANTAENLLIDKHDVETNRHYFAICNPNLKPVTNATYKWIASVSQTTLTLVGEWLPLNPVSGVVFSEPLAGQTQVTVNFSQGEPVYFGIKQITDTTGIKSVKKNDWVYYSKNENELQLRFSTLATTNSVVKIHNTSGQIIYNQSIKQATDVLNIATQNLQRGLLICTVTDGKNTSSLKWIN
jgi:hypothetical protein